MPWIWLCLALIGSAFTGFMCWSRFRKRRPLVGRWILVGSCSGLLLGLYLGAVIVHDSMHRQSLKSYVTEVFEGMTACELPRLDENMATRDRDQLMACFGEPFGQFEIEDIQHYPSSRWLRIRFSNGEAFDLEIKLVGRHFVLQGFTKSAVEIERQ